MTSQECDKITADFDTVTNKIYGIEKGLHNGIDEIKTELEEIKKCIEQSRSGWAGFWSGINKIPDNINIKGSDLIFPLNSYDEDKRNIRKDFPI